jgi:hypothetical protein
MLILLNIYVLYFFILFFELHKEYFYSSRVVSHDSFAGCLKVLFYIASQNSSVFPRMLKVLFTWFYFTIVLLNAPSPI